VEASRGATGARRGSKSSKITAILRHGDLLSNREKRDLSGAGGGAEPTTAATPGSVSTPVPEAAPPPEDAGYPCREREAAADDLADAPADLGLPRSRPCDGACDDAAEGHAAQRETADESPSTWTRGCCVQSSSGAVVTGCGSNPAELPVVSTSVDENKKRRGMPTPGPCSARSACAWSAPPSSRGPWLPRGPSHRTGLVGLTSGSSGRRGPRLPSYSGAGVFAHSYPNPSVSWTGTMTARA
jgi:hypothetical protein